MSLITRGAVACAVALAATAAALATAHPGKASTAGLLPSCPNQAYEQPFLRWLDVGSYVPAPNGGLEQGAAGWTLTGGATTVSGNESFSVGGTDDSTSLSLPAGATATTGQICVGLASPTLRLFVRNTGSLLSTLTVEAVYTDLSGQERVLPVSAVLAGSSWQPTLPTAFLANLTALPLVTDGTMNVAFRFTANGALGRWRIDDVYVDPFKGE